MAVTREEFYGSQDPHNLPAYFISQASHHLSVPNSTLRSWVAGSSYETKAGRKRSLPLIEPIRNKPYMLSFWNMIELQILASIRRRHKVSMPRVRKALNFVQSELGIERPLIKAQFSTDGVDLFVKDYGGLFNATTRERESLSLQRQMRAALDRIERDEFGIATRMFPWREDPLQDLRVVAIDPATKFGQPVVRGTRIATAVLASRRRGGEAWQSIADDCQLKVDSVVEAVRWELGKAA